MFAFGVNNASLFEFFFFSTLKTDLYYEVTGVAVEEAAGANVLAVKRSRRAALPQTFCIVALFWTVIISAWKKWLLFFQNYYFFYKVAVGFEALALKALQGGEGSTVLFYLHI